MMLAPVLLMLVIPRMMKNLDPESQKVRIPFYANYCIGNFVLAIKQTEK